MPGSKNQRKGRQRNRGAVAGRANENARQASSEQCRLLFESNPNPMWIFDAATLQFLAVNEAAIRLYGWTRAEFLAMTVKDVRPPEEVSKLAEKLARQRDSRATFVGQWRHWKKDRALLEVEATISCLQFQGRDARLALVHDVTERTRAEGELRQSREYLAVALEAAKAGSWHMDYRAGRTYWSAEYYRLFGLNPKRVKPTFAVWLALIHPADRGRVEEEAQGVLKRKQTDFHLEFRVKLRRGGVRWIADTGHVTYDAQGRPLRAAGINMDITERKRSEALLQRLNATLEQRVAERTEELSDAHDRLRAITDSALIGILTLDGRGVVETLNPAAAAMFGYAPDEMRGRNVSEFMASPHEAQGEPFLTHYTRSGDQRFMGAGREVVGRRKDGHATMLEVTVSDFTHAGRRVFVAMVRDITERKRLERELLEVSERERQRLGHDLHDGLGQHLHALFYMATLLEKELQEASLEQAPEAGQLARQLEHGLKLIRSLARGLQPVNPVPEGLMAALGELAARTRAMYGVDSRFQCPAPVLIHRHSAANHLYRIAQEAVNNAMKHGKPTRIRLKLTATPKRIVLGIRDNGRGIGRRSAHAHGMGLHVMQYRANALSGSLLVQRHPEGGTEVVCTVNRQALLPDERNMK